MEDTRNGKAAQGAKRQSENSQDPDADADHLAVGPTATDGKPAAETKPAKWPLFSKRGLFRT